MSAALKQADPTDLGLDVQFLTRELDKTKSGVFLGKNAAFLGSLMCSLNFYWTEDHKTAATDGVNLMWNPHWFLKLKPEPRKTVLMHELWHPGRLHFIRMGDRNPLVWNWATDIRINNDLKAEGYSFEGIEWCWMDPSYPPGMPEEDIYDDLIAQGKTFQGGAWSQHLPPPDPNAPPDDLPDDGSDMLSPMTKDDMARAVNNVVRAVHQAKLGGGTGTIPGEVETILKQFLAPIVPWEQLLHQFMHDLIDEGYSWQRPNRRFPDLYLPSRHEDEGRLTHLIYYEDVSGSISDKDNLRFNSEIKYVKEIFNPKNLSLVQFDTRITQETTYGENDPFEEIKIVGRGGTSLVPVREHIIANRPTAAIIFSDLECEPMEPLPFELPVIWVAIRARGVSVPFGKLIHIR